MKTFKFRNAVISIEKTHGYGQYTLRGLGTSVHCTDSVLYEFVDNREEGHKKYNAARKAAYNALKANKY